MSAKELKHIARAAEISEFANTAAETLYQACADPGVIHTSAARHLFFAGARFSSPPPGNVDLSSNRCPVNVYTLLEAKAEIGRLKVVAKDGNVFAVLIDRLQRLEVLPHPRFTTHYHYIKNIYPSQAQELLLECALLFTLELNTDVMAHLHAAMVQKQQLSNSATITVGNTTNLAPYNAVFAASHQTIPLRGNTMYPMLRPHDHSIIRRDAWEIDMKGKELADYMLNRFRVMDDLNLKWLLPCMPSHVKWDILCVPTAITNDLFPTMSNPATLPVGGNTINQQFSFELKYHDIIGIDAYEHDMKGRELTRYMLNRFPKMDDWPFKWLLPLNAGHRGCHILCVPPAITADLLNCS